MCPGVFLDDLAALCQRAGRNGRQDGRALLAEALAQAVQVALIVAGCDEARQRELLEARHGAGVKAELRAQPLHEPRRQAEVGNTQ